MVRAHDALAEAGLQARLILQIHDELLLEAPAGEAGRAGAIVREAMVGAYALDPPARRERGHRRDVAGREGVEARPLPRAAGRSGSLPGGDRRGVRGAARDDPARRRPDAPQRLARLNAAHRTLSDPALRAAHDAGGWHLAQVNIALPREPLDAPLLADFVAALAPVNAVADASPGFVWRLQTEDGDATAIRAFGDDRLIVNMSVWESVEALRGFVYGEAHAAVLRRRREWFERLGRARDRPLVGRRRRHPDDRRRGGAPRPPARPRPDAASRSRCATRARRPPLASAGQARPGRPEQAGHRDPSGGRGLGA